LLPCGYLLKAFSQSTAQALQLGYLPRRTLSPTPPRASSRRRPRESRTNSVFTSTCGPGLRLRASLGPLLQGSAAFGTPRTVGRPHETLQMGAGETLTVANDGVGSESNGPCRFVLVAGQPLNEPIEQHGPFVMNDREGIQQAIRDYQVRR